MARRTVKKSQARQSKKPKTKPKSKPQEPLLSGVSPQRRVDIVAILLLLIGSLTLISLFTQRTGTLTAWWVRSLATLMGWGVFILPLALIIFGAWILFRNNQQFPRLSTERTIGIILFFLNLTAWFHLIIDGGFSEAQVGSGGGYLGAAIKVGFVQLLGRPGAIVALIAWLLISLILTLNLAMANIINAIGQLLKWIGEKIRQVFMEIQARVREQRQARKSSAQEEAEQVEEEPHPQEAQPVISGTPETALSDQNQQAATPQEPVWVLPDPNEILDPVIEPPDDSENDRHRARVIEETLRSFGAPAHVVEIRRGPTVTLFGV
ncbi:MAG: DNA translocase FtsK 4TM domain-containing protein, partial [Brevefilum sp.]